MSTRRESFGSRRRRRRTVGFVALGLALLLLLAAGAFAFVRDGGVGFGNGSGEGSGEGSASEEAKRSGQGDGSGGGSEGAAAGERRGGGSGGDGSGNEDPEPERPFEAVPAPDNGEEAARSPENGLSLAALERISVGGAEGAADAQYEENEPTAGQTTGGFEDSGPERSVPEGETLLAGREDETDGPLKDHRLVAYYGHPWVAEMGILGEHEPEELMRLLKEQAAAYTAADPERPAVPMIELIASVAQRDPGPDGLYVTQTPKEELRKYSKLAKDNGALLMLDVQLGRATIEQEVEILRPFLEQPHVHLAIDTEYSIEPGEVPGEDLGEVDGPEIQEAVERLDALVEEEDLPDKILLVHQFEDGIVTNKDAISATDDVQVVLHADGFGGPEAKFTKYRQLVRDQPIQYGGFKVFYRQDEPVLNPEQVLTLDPAPAVVTYQ